MRMWGLTLLLGAALVVTQVVPAAAGEFRSTTQMAVGADGARSGGPSPSRGGSARPPRGGGIGFEGGDSIVGVPIATEMVWTGAAWTPERAGGTRRGQPSQKPGKGGGKGLGFEGGDSAPIMRVFPTPAGVTLTAEGNGSTTGGSGGKGGKGGSSDGPGIGFEGGDSTPTGLILVADRSPTNPTRNSPGTTGSSGPKGTVGPTGFEGGDSTPTG
ncbi:MAG: hypothetical protein HY660_08550, partial [Armatimonadetes bacterium]|nr:hypothetical protein [Armatimonadota bacterium]